MKIQIRMKNSKPKFKLNLLKIFGFGPFKNV